MMSNHVTASLARHTHPANVSNIGRMAHEASWRGPENVQKLLYVQLSCDRVNHPVASAATRRGAHMFDGTRSHLLRADVVLRSSESPLRRRKET